MNASDGERAEEREKERGEDMLPLVLALIFFFIALGIRGWDIFSIWPDDARGWAGAFYGNVAKNFNTFGFSATKGAMVPDINPRDPSEFSYYMDHPPMVGWLLAGSIKALGYHAWAVRIVALACSMGGLVGLYFIIKRACGARRAAYCFVLLSLLPMGVFYGAFADVQGPIVFFFCVLTILSYQWFAEKPGWGSVFAMLGAFFLAALTDWPAYYLVPILIVHYFLTARRKNWKIVLLPVLAAITGVGFLLHQNYVLTGEPSLGIDVMLGAFLSRFGGPAGATGFGAAPEHFTAGDWLNRVVFTWLPQYFTLPCLVLGGAWTVVVLARVAARKASAADSLFLIFLVFGAIHVLLFRQGAYIHRYWSYYLLPAVALGSVMAVTAAAGALFRRKTGTATVVTIVAVLALASWGAAQSVALAKETTRLYSAIGITLAGDIGRDSLLVNDFLERYGMDFYFSNRVQYAPVLSVNLQLMSQRKNVSYYFFSNMFTSSEKNKVFGALHGQGIIRMDYKKGYLVDMRGFDYEACFPALEAPKIVKWYWEGEVLYLQWSHPSPDKVAHYRIYARQEHEPFYKEGIDVEGTEFSGEVPGFMRLVVAIVAVNAEGEESKFEEEIFTRRR